ncbi:MAG: hypothetical protein AN484_15480 [Aphanizomenon flos-aquae WA102]|uniref:Uncharacterized protein n=1 Tax=Aphanizomenon flos-aquae WA102 TaxID=1710896 RepID=A0A1B7X0H8_APHFL|nr:MAG: hypothetical protein AN484_15480 [Aphanizomenon flos-aquae WA102]
MADDVTPRRDTEVLDHNGLVLREDAASLGGDEADGGAAELGGITDELVRQDALRDVAFESREEAGEGGVGAVALEGRHVLPGLKGDEFAAHRVGEVGVGAGPGRAELVGHVAVDDAARLLDDAGDVAVVLHGLLLEGKDFHLVLDGVDGVLEQGDATGAGRVLLVDHHHHRLGENLAGRAVGAVDVHGDVFAIRTELDAVVHTFGHLAFKRVADAVGFHQLKFGFTGAVTHLGGEGITVADHAAEKDGLSLVETEAVRDVDALGLFGEVSLVAFLHLRRRRVALRLDAVAHRVEADVGEDLLKEPGVTLGPAALAHHRQAVVRGQVTAKVTRFGAVGRTAGTRHADALPIAVRSLRLRGGRHGLGRLRTQADGRNLLAGGHGN